MPYSGSNDTAALHKIQAGETPQQPSDEIYDAVWEFLEKCWNRNPSKRPPIAQISDAFSEFRSLPQVMPTPATEELPGKLKLHVQSVKIPLDKSKQHEFSVRFKYGNKGHTTALAKPMGGSDEHTWFGLRSLLPSPPSLSFTQEQSGNLVNRNQ